MTIKTIDEKPTAAFDSIKQFEKHSTLNSNKRMVPKNKGITFKTSVQ